MFNANFNSISAIPWHNKRAETGTFFCFWGWGILNLGQNIPELYFNFPDIREPVVSPGSAYCEYTTFQKYFATDIHPTLNSNLLFPHQSLKKNRMECYFIKVCPKFKIFFDSVNTVKIR
jgi:hypothetical protein